MLDASSSWTPSSPSITAQQLRARARAHPETYPALPSSPSLPVLLFFACLQATHHNGFLYVATGEYWGYDYVRMPSIYWAIIKSTDNLCELARKDHGLIASQVCGAVLSLAF